MDLCVILSGHVRQGSGQVDCVYEGGRTGDLAAVPPVWGDKVHCSGDHSAGEKRIFLFVIVIKV